MKFLKFLFIFLVIILFFIAVIVLAAFFLPPAKPIFVNQNLQFENKLSIPSLLEPRKENGEKVFDLTLAPGETQFFKGKQTKTFGFNGSYLGPTLHAVTGDKVRLNVINMLAESTTVHWHGMHLPASMDGGPHQVIKHNEIWKPYWTITNEAATLWYHPHLMGKTGQQVYQGLAGLFIIDDKNSDSLALPKDYGVDDIPVIVQDREFDHNGQFVYEHDRKDILGETGMLGDTILVNGTYAPYLSVPAKQIRLRILNASNARRYNFAFADKRKFYQLATDGGFLNSPVERSGMILGPGERAEILIDLTGQTKPLTLISDAVYEQYTIFRFVKHLLHIERDENEVFNILELRPQTMDSTVTSLPTKLNIIKKLDPKQARKTRTFVLDPRAQTINGQKMTASRINEVIHVGDVEIWDIENDSGTFHPFHIHGVQFQVLTIDGKSPPLYEQGWKDTVLVPNGERVRVIMQFPKYADSQLPYMYHCHILEHEDMGMMGQFLVVDDPSHTSTHIGSPSMDTSEQQNMMH